MRVAIVGCGPKGLYALERLVAHARAADLRSAIAVDVYEPHPVPGAGPVYDPAQPRFLRMNFAADMVDIWPAGSGLGPSFSEWRKGVPGLSDESYPPRADVGRYLNDGFERLVSTAAEFLDISVRATGVNGIRREGETWSVIAGDDLSEYDEVLLTTGHAPSWDGGLGSGMSPPENLIGAVFPVETHLSAETVPPGSAVSVRGFALTMIDAALALTEGRGGTFREGRAHHLLAYDPSQNDVARILPYSRTGRPMLAKPDPALAPSSGELDEIAASGSAALMSLPEQARLADAVAHVANVASESLRVLGVQDDSEIRRHLDDAQSGRSTPAGISPAEEIERSIAVGVGQGEPGADWALGHAWRGVYPALVDRLGADGLDTADWPAFRRLGTEMERISFGPPPVNAAKLLALIEGGKVDLGNLATGPAPEADIVIDAVLPPPGALDINHAPLDALLRDGHARIPLGRRGLELTADVTCVGADGVPRRGLGAIGRPTEDWVIGNDTLNRALHPQPELWARRIAERAASA